MEEGKRPIDTLLQIAKMGGYTGDTEHLSGIISNNPEAAEHMLGLAKMGGYTGDMEHFVSTFGVQEGNVGATVDGGEESQASSGAEQTTEEFVMPEIQQATQESVYDAIQESQKTELEKITGAVESKLTEEAAASRSEQMGQRIKDNVLSVTPENVEDFYKTFGIEKEKTDHNGIMRVDMPWEVIGDMEPDEQSAMLQQLALYNNPELLKKYKELSDTKRAEYNAEKYGTFVSDTTFDPTAYDRDAAEEAGEVSKMNLEEKMAHFDKKKAEVLNEAIQELQKDANESTVSTLIADLEGQGIDVSKLSEDEVKNLEARLNIATNGSFNLNEDDDIEKREDATVVGDMLRGFGAEALNIYAGIQQSVADVTGSTMSGLYAYKGAEMADDLRSDMTEYLTSLSDDVSNMDIGRVAERTVVMLGESAPLMLVAAAAGAVTGGTGAGAVTTMAVEFGATAGVSMLGTYGDVSNEEWFNELGGVEKLGYVAETGVAEGLPAVVGARIFKHAFKTAAPSYSAFVANRSAQNLGAFLKGATKSTLLGMLEEGTTEGLTGVWQASSDSRYKRAAIENQLQDPNLSTEERNQLQSEYDSLEFTMEGAKEAFIEGGLGGILLGGGMSTLGTAGRSAFTEYAFMKQPELKAILKLSGEVEKNAARVIAGMDSETRAARAKVGQTLQLIQEAEGRGDVEAAKQLQKQMAEELKLVNATVASRQEFYNGLDEDKRMDLAALYTKLEAGARSLKSKNTKDSEKSSIREEIAETVKAINDFRAENDIDVDGRSDVDFIKDINLNIDAVALYGNIAPESGNVDLEGDIQTELLQAAETVLGRGKLDQDARDAIQALADVAGMKGGPVRLHYTRESYGRDVGVENAASTNGFFRTSDGTVHIFAPTMTRTTAYHETIHRIAGEDLESSEAGKALGAMLESMPEGVAEEIKMIAAANMRAKGISFNGQRPSVEEIMADSDVVDEVLTEFLAKVSSGKYNVDYRRGFRQGVIKMIDGLTGGNLTPVNRRRIQHMRINQAVDAFNMVRDAFRESDTEGVKAGIQQLANIKGEAAPVADTTTDTTTDTETAADTTTDTEVAEDTAADTTTEAAPEVDTAEDTTTETAPDAEAVRRQRIKARRKVMRTAVMGVNSLASRSAIQWDGSKFVLSDIAETRESDQSVIDALNELFAEAFAKEGALPSVGDLRYYAKSNQSAAEARAEQQAYTEGVVSGIMETLLTGKYTTLFKAVKEGQSGGNQAAVRDNDAWVFRNRGKGAEFSSDDKGAQIAVYEDGSVSIAPFFPMGDMAYRHTASGLGVNGKLFSGETKRLGNEINKLDRGLTDGMNIGELAAEVLSGALVQQFTGKAPGKPQLESMDVDSIDNQNEQEAGSMFMGEVDMRRGKPQLAMGDLDYATQPSYDPDTYLEVYNEDDLPEELRLSMPDPVELETVLNKSKGAAVFINSDGTKVGVVRGQNIQGGYRYVFLNEAQEAKAGFASTSKTHVGVMHKLVSGLDKERRPEDKGAPVAVFVTIQAAETMTGEWYSAKYVADGIAEILEKGMLTEEQVLDALVDAYVIGEADTAAKRPAKKAKVLAADLDVYNAEVEKAKEKARKELAKDGINEPTEEQIEDTYPMHMSKDAQVGYIVGEIAKGSMDSQRVQDLFTNKMTFGGRVSLIGNTLAYVETANPLSNALLELGYSKMEFFREYMDEAPLAMFEKALAADKNKESAAKYERAAGVIKGMVMGGFYADPSLDPDVAKENAKGRVAHRQFDTAFTSNGEVFRLNKPYNVDTLQFRIGAPTKQGVSFYNEHAGGDKYYKGTDKKDIMASIAPSDVSKVESLVEGGMSVRQAVQSIGYVEYARKHKQGVSDFIMEAAVGSAAPETKSRYSEFVVAQKGDDVRAMSKLMTSPYGNVSISAYPSGIIKLQSDMVERLGSESKAVGESIIEAYNSMDKGAQSQAFKDMFASQEKMIPFSGQGLVEASQKGEAVQQLREKLEAAPEGKKQVGDVDMLGDLVESMYNGWTASEARTMLKEFGFSKTQVDELMRLAQQRLRGRREGIREEYRSRIEERKEARKNSTLATNLQAKLDAERLAGKTQNELTSIIIKLISQVVKEQGIKGLKVEHIKEIMSLVAKPTRSSKKRLNGEEAADLQEKIIEKAMQLEAELAKGRKASEVLAKFKKDVSEARKLQSEVRRRQTKKGGIHLAYKQAASMMTSIKPSHLSPEQVAELVSTLKALIETQKTGVVKGEVRDRSSVDTIKSAAKKFQAQSIEFNTMSDLRRAERMAKRENAKRKQQNRAQVTVQDMLDKLYADRHVGEIKRLRTTIERLADERGIDISTPESLAAFEAKVAEEYAKAQQDKVDALSESAKRLALAAQYQLANNDSLSKIYGEDINARIDQLTSEGDYYTLAKLELVLYNAAVNNSFADIKKLASDMHYRFHSMPKLKALMKSGKIKVRKRGSGRRVLSALDTMDSALSMIVIADKRALSQVREALGLTGLEIGFARAKSAFDSLIDGGYGDGAFPGLVGLLKKAGVDMNQMTKTPFSAALQAIATLEQKPQGYDSVEWASDLYKAMEKSIGQASIQVDKYSKSDVKEMRENILDVYEEGMTMEEYSEALIQKHPKSREIITTYRTVHQRARARWGYDSFYEETLGTQPEMGENYTPFSFSRVLKSGVEDNSMAKIVQDRMTGNVVPSDKESKTSTSKERKRNAIKGVVSGEFVMDLDFHSINTGALWSNSAAIFASDSVYEARSIMGQQVSDGTQTLPMSEADAKMMLEFIEQYSNPSTNGRNMVFQKKYKVHGVEFSNPLYYAKKAAVVKAFGSLFGAQILKQSSVGLSVLAQTTHMSSKSEFVEYVALMSAMSVKRGSTNMNKIMPDAMKRMLMENSPVFQRDYESALVDSDTSGHVSFDENYLDIVSDKLSNVSLAMLKGTDKVMAAASWFAFYSDYIRSEEGRDVNWEEESKNPNADAVGHANRMVSKDQAASTARQAAQLYSTKSGAVKFFLDTIMPFSRFGINKKRSIVSDVIKLMHAPTAEAKREAASALAGHFSEMYAFATIGSFVIPAIAAAVLGDEDEIPEFFSTKQQLTIVSRVIKDVALPMNLEVTDALAVNEMNKLYYGAFVRDEYTEGMTDSQAEKAYEDWLRRNGASVFISKDDIKKNPLKYISGIMGPAGSWAYDASNSVRNLKHAVAGDGKYVKPNGDVVYIDPDFQDRAATTSMLEFGMMLGQFAGLSSQEVGKLTRMYDDAHIATSIKRESDYLYRLDKEGLLGDLSYYEALQQAGLLDNVDDSDFNRMDRSADAIQDKKILRDIIIDRFGKDFYMDHAEELVYDAYLSPAGIAEIFREEDAKYVEALKLMLSESKLDNALNINRKRNE